MMQRIIIKIKFGKTTITIPISFSCNLPGHIVCFYLRKNILTMESLQGNNKEFFMERKNNRNNFFNILIFI